MDEQQSAELYRDAGRLFRGKQYHEALEKLTELERTFPQNKDILFARAQCLAALGRQDEAAEVGSRLVALGDPRGAEFIKGTSRVKPMSSDEAKASQETSPPPRRGTRVSSRRLILAGCVVAFVLGLVVYQWGVRPALYRTLPFGDGVEGVIYTREIDGDETWRRYDEANGTLVVPRRAATRLILTAPPPITAFSRFDPDSFEELAAPNIAFGAVDLAFLLDLPGLRRLDLNGTQITDDALFYVGQVPALEELNLQGTRVTALGLSALSGLARLEKIDLRNTNAIGSGLDQLAGLPNLKELHASQSILPSGVEALAAIETLERLDLSGANLRDEELAPLQNLAALRSLNLSNTPITHAALAHLEGLDRLESLRLAHTRVADPATGYLMALPALARLDLTGAPFTERGLMRLGQLPNLSAINLSACCGRPEVTLPALSAIAALPSLTSLEISHAQLGDEAVGVLEPASLQRLVWEESGLTAAAVKNLAALVPAAEITRTVEPNQILRFPTERVIGRIFVAGAGGTDWRLLGPANGDVWMPAEAEVRIEYSPAGAAMPGDWNVIDRGRVRSVAFEPGVVITPALAAALARWEMLEELDFLATKLSDETLRHVPSFENLRALSLADTDITNDGLLNLPRFTALADLRLDGTVIDERGLNRLARMANLRRLSLRRTVVTGASLNRLLNEIALERLDLGETTVGPALLTSLREQHPQIEILPGARPTFPLVFPDDANLGSVWARPVTPPDAQWRRVGAAQGTVMIDPGEALRIDVAPEANPTVVLDAISDANVQSLRFAGVTQAIPLERLAQFAALQELDLFGTPTGDRDLAQLVALSELQSLNLARTAITDDAASSLAPLHALRELDLAHTKVTDTSLAALAALPNLRRVYVDGTDVTTAGAKSPAASRSEVMGVFEAPAARRRSGVSLAEYALPEGVSLGNIWFRSNDAPDSEWTAGGSLCCARTLPRDTERRLAVPAADAPALAHLSALPDDAIHILELAPGTRIDADTLDGIAGFTSLHTLVLDGVSIAPGGLRPLSALPNLRTLRLFQAEFDDAELAYLRGLPQLRELDISATPTTDNGFAHVATAPALEKLDAHATAISDTSLVYATGLQQLNTLDLNRTGLSDRTLPHLAALPRLRHVNVTGTTITETTAQTVMPTGVQVEFHAAVVRPEEAARMKRALQQLADAETGLTSTSFAAVAGVAAVSDIAADSLPAFQSAALESLADSTTGITPATLAALAGAESFEAVPPQHLQELQERALAALANSQTGITPAALAAVNGDLPLDVLPEERREQLQYAALTAMADSTTGITPQSLATVSGTVSYQDLTNAALPRLRRLATTAMADSDTGITSAGLAALYNAQSIQTLGQAERTELQELALAAMAQSETGITADGILAIVGEGDFASLDADSRRDLQEMALAYMARSETGISPAGMAALGGVNTYDELPLDSREFLEKLALATLAKDDMPLSSQRLAAIGGVASYEQLPEARRGALQFSAISAYLQQDRALTPEFLAQTVGVETFAAIAPGRLERLQRSVFRAFAETRRSIPQAAFALATGRASGQAVPAVQLGQLQGVALASLAEAPGGLSNPASRELVSAGQLSSVSLADMDVTDEDLRPFRQATVLRSLDLSGCRRVTDLGMAHLAEAPLLESLFLGKTGVGNDGLAALATLSLRNIDLSETSVTDQGLAVLSEMTTLETLSLRGTSITGGGIFYLRSLPRLRAIDLSETAITDAALAELAAIETLEVVRLGGTRLTDAAMPHLAKIPGLTTLELHDIPFISDVGVRSLRNHRQLASLSLYATPVTGGASDTLMTLPNLEQLSLNAYTFSAEAVTLLQERMPRLNVQRLQIQPSYAEPVEVATRRNPLQRAVEYVMEEENTRELFAGSLALTLASALLVPFFPALNGLDVPGRTTRTAVLSGRITYRFSLVSAVYAYQLMRAFFGAFWWLVLLVLGAIGAYFLSNLLGFGFDELLRTLE